MNQHELPPIGTPKLPALYASVEHVLNTGRNKYEAFLNGHGFSPEESLKHTFQKLLDDPRTNDKDKELIRQAMEQGYN